MAADRRRAGAWWSAWAALVGLLGVVLLVAGGYLLTRAPVVRADPIPAPSAVREQHAGSPPVAGGGPGPALPGQTADGVPQRAPGPPATVSFPAQNITADVVPVGVLDSGALQLPEDPARVGWWADGAMPGAATGTTVLAGHMDGRRQSGAMRALLQVAQGDVIDVADSLGAVHPYRVVSRLTTPWNHLDAGLFTRDGPHRLALITCGGTFDEGSGRYLDNVVVLGEPITSRTSP